MNLQIYVFFSTIQNIFTRICPTSGSISSQLKYKIDYQCFKNNPMANSLRSF